MAVRLTKIINDNTLDQWRQRINIPLDVLSGVHPRAILNFSMNMEARGGSFEVVLENYYNNYAFRENDFVTVFRRESLDVKGVIRKIVPSVTTNGYELKISGELKPLATAYNTPITFSTATPFWYGNKTGNIEYLVPSPPMYDVANNYRLFDLDANKILSIYSQRTGVPIANSPLNYPVFQYDSNIQSFIDSVDEIYKHAGANAVLRFDGGVYITALNWGTSLSSHVIDFSDTEGGLEPTYETSTFTDVVLECNSQVTPWNSTYTGLPEQIGTMEIELGTQALSDLSASSSSGSGTDWLFPDNGGNVWLSYSTNDTFYTPNYVDDLGVRSVWLAEEVGRSITYTTISTKDYMGLALGTAQQEMSSITVPSSRTDYRLLYRWKIAVKRFESVGDIHPQILVLPADAPEFVNNFDIDSEPFYNVRPYNLQRFTPSGAAFSGPLQGLTPGAGFCIDAYADENLARKGFADDGAFYVGVEPKPRILPESGEYQPVLENEKITEFSPSGFVIDVPARQPKPVYTSSGEVQGTRSFKTEKRAIIASFGEDDDQKKALVKSLSAKISRDGLNLLLIPSPNGDQHLAILSKGVSEDGLKLELTLEALPKQAYKGQVRLGRVLTKAGIGFAMEYVPQPAVQVFDSGTVDQNPTPVKGGWTLYAFKRKNFPPTIICPVGGEPIISYTGLLPYQPLEPKVASASLVTDYWSTSPQITHAGQLAKALASYFAQPFISFSVSIIDKGQPIPQPGDSLTVRNVPNHGDVTGIVVSSGISISPSGGSSINVTCGRLETL